MAIGFVLLVIWLRLLTVTCMDQKTQQLVKRLEDSKSQTFATLTDQSLVYHLELDNYRPGNIIYTDYSALKTSDGVTTTVIAGNSSNWGYREGVGEDALFYGITGFAQVSLDRIIAAETPGDRDCMRMIHRRNGSTSAFTGECGQADDYYPHHWRDVYGPRKPPIYTVSCVIRDNQDPEKILFTNDSRVVRSASINNGNVGIFLDTGGRMPFITQRENGDIYVISGSVLYRINYYNKAVTHIAGRKFIGTTVDGSQADSNFHSPRNLLFIGYGIFLVADGTNKNPVGNIRLVDMNDDNISTINICSGCITLNLPYSLLMTNDSLYIGESGQILQFPYLASTAEPPATLSIPSPNIPPSSTSDLCLDRNRTVYVTLQIEKANVRIAPDTEIELPVGNHTYMRSGCINTVQVVSNASEESCGELPVIDNAELVRTSDSDREGSQVYYQCNTKVTSGDGLYTCTKTHKGLEWLGNTLLCQRDIIVPVLTGIFILALVITGILLIVFCLKVRLSRLNRNTLEEQSNKTADRDPTGTQQHPQYEELCLNNLPSHEYAVPEHTSGSQERHDTNDCYEEIE